MYPSVGRGVIKHVIGRGELRAQPEPRAQSARESRAKPEIERGGGLGRGLDEPLSRKILKIHTWNHAFWCIVEAKIYIFPQRI